MMHVMWNRRCINIPYFTSCLFLNSCYVLLFVILCATEGRGRSSECETELESQIFVWLWVLSFNMQYHFLLFGIDRGIINYTFLLFLFISFCIFLSLFLYRRTFLHHKQYASKQKVAAFSCCFFFTLISRTYHFSDFSFAQNNWSILYLASKSSRPAINNPLSLSLSQCYQLSHLNFLRSFHDKCYFSYTKNNIIKTSHKSVFIYQSSFCFPSLLKTINSHVINLTNKI